MRKRAQCWLHEMLSAFRAGDDAAVADLCSEKLPIYLERELIATATRSDLVAVLKALRAEFVRAGMRDLQSEIVAVGLPQRDRIELLVECRYDMGPERPERRAGITYYLKRRGATALVLEMVEYRTEAFPMQALARAIGACKAPPEAIDRRNLRYIGRTGRGPLTDGPAGAGRKRIAHHRATDRRPAG